MSLRTMKIVLLAAMFALATSIVGFAQGQPCPIPNQVFCQGWDGSDNLLASQNDTLSGFGNFASVYQQFDLTQTIDVESVHFVGGYFNPAVQGPITAWTLNLYDDNGGIPGNLLAFGVFPGTGNETFIGFSPSGFPIYQYELDFLSFDMNAGTYWASVVPDLGFPPQWGWATSAGANQNGYQCFFGACAPTGIGFALGIDGTVVSGVPEPGTLIMLGTGILGLAGSLRRKLL